MFLTMIDDYERGVRAKNTNNEHKRRITRPLCEDDEECAANTLDRVF